MTTNTIRVRSTTCKCGCHGRDPWHRQSYKRVVRQVVQVEATTNTTDIARQVVVARGVASFPWGEESVVATVWSFDGKMQRTQDWRLETMKR